MSCASTSQANTTTQRRHGACDQYTTATPLSNPIKNKLRNGEAHSLHAGPQGAGLRLTEILCDAAIICTGFHDASTAGTATGWNR